MKTPLFDAHLKAGAKIVDFSGWEMPIQYAGIIAEHHQTRNNVSLFDVSHMGEFTVQGKDAEAFLNYATVNNLSAVKPGQAQYNAMIYETGGVVDDIICYKNSPEDFLICVNASNIEKDFAHLQQYASKFDVALNNISENVALIAIQGKTAPNILADIGLENVDQIKYYHFIKTNLVSCPASVARLGYTGEDGFEIACHPKDATTIWDSLMSAGKKYNITPAGLGARDTLRLEVCFPLYGNDLDDKHNPYESGLGWIVKLSKSDFVGKATLEKWKQSDAEKIRLRPFKVVDKGIPRHGQPIFQSGGNEVGIVTSGTFSPTLSQGIGMGYFPASAAIDDEFEIHANKRMIKIKIQSPPFVQVKKT